MSSTEELRVAQLAVEAAAYAAAPPELALAIKGALMPPGPVGSPPAIADRADEYTRAATDAAAVGLDLSRVARAALPAAWRGAAAESAAQAVDVLTAEVDTTVTVLGQAAAALRQWSADLDRAQQQDRQGYEALTDAAGRLGFLGAEVWNLPAAARQALTGVTDRLAAARLAEESGFRTASALRELGAEARAGHVTAAGMDPLSAMMLAGEADPGSGPILAENALARGSQLLDRMSPADRAAFEQLLRRARSPQEAAYLWKAMSAGHTPAGIAAFGRAIHPHGDDPVWLAEHLTPGIAGGDATNAHVSLTYLGVDSDVYAQGSVNDCVAASTVVARATVDPALMLELTTGGLPGGDDSPAAFQRRLQDVYRARYVAGQRADGDAKVYPGQDDGVGADGEDLLADQDLGTTTGADYHHLRLGSAADRHGALPAIERAVDSGVPVPIDVKGGGSAHQMMIIGRDGDRLQIYNPWGYTTWVSESDFVHDRLGDATGTAMNSADAVELPR